MHQDLINNIAGLLPDATIYYVGGCVRDELLGLTPKDFDVEIFGVEAGKVKDALCSLGEVHEVGANFGVLKLYDIDFTLPRRENKAGKGHRGFDVQVDPFMSVADAASRRDFTVNAIYKNAVTGEIADPHNGRDDIRNGTLRAVGPAFKEDPLRVLRGMQFASRFNMRIQKNTDTHQYCVELLNQYADLATERIGEEWRKWAKGNYPHNGLQLLKDTRWDQNFYPILNLAGIQQNPTWHPEIWVDLHTGYVCDAMANICTRENITGEDREVLMFAALCHDFGKVSTTIVEDGKIKSPGHAEVSVMIAEPFLKSIGIFDRVIQRVLPLIKEHMYNYWDIQTSRTVRRLKHRLGKGTIPELLLLIEADLSGRPPLPPTKAENHDKIMKFYNEFPPEITPILTGRHILDMGITVGTEIGRIKKLAFEHQLNEEFINEAGAVEWLRNYLNENPQR